MENRQVTDDIIASLLHGTLLFKSLAKLYQPTESIANSNHLNFEGPQGERKLEEIPFPHQLCLGWEAVWLLVAYRVMQSQDL